MVGWHHWLNGHEFEQAPGVGDRQRSLLCCSPWGCRVRYDRATELNCFICLSVYTLSFSHKKEWNLAIWMDLEGIMLSEVSEMWVSRWVRSNSCDPIDCSPPGSSVHWIFQARLVEWVAISFFRGSSQPRDWTWASCFAGRFLTNWATRKFPDREDMWHLNVYILRLSS